MLGIFKKIERIPVTWICLVGTLGFFLGTVVIEWKMGCSLFGPDKQFGLWEGNIWSAECSQRIADAYSFSHFIHGILFFTLLWFLARGMPPPYRFLIAVMLEAGWELLENSPIIIDRYRETTAAFGYAGDSILNSASDMVMMCLGFLFAWRVPIWISVTAIVLMEVGCALWIRDNLLLNIIMLIHPFEAIKTWQMAGQP